MGLGSVSTFTLKEARERARTCRQLVADGIDPIEVRKATRTAHRLERAQLVTFEQSAAAYIEEHSKRWKSAKHRVQWPATLGAHAYPLIGGLPVAEIDTGLVLKILRPIWDRTPETASRVRGRIEAVLDWATAQGHRTGDNPARWRGHLKNLLATKPGAKHYDALPFEALPGFIAELRRHDGISARALEFTILTAARTSETLGAKWSEVKGSTWTIPAKRMKAGKEHDVPLSKRALVILQALPREGEYVFVGGRAHRPLSTHGMLGLLRRMRSGVTVHGFRSTFRDWAGDRTNFAREVIEHALAHRIKDKAEASYRRSAALDKRRRLMEEWARYCGTTAVTADVVALHG